MRALLAVHYRPEPTGLHRYVATTGSDSNPGTRDAPWKTINKAASMATAGMTIHVAPGTYDETLHFDKNGTATSRIRFVSDIKWGAKIWSSRDLYFSNWPDCHIVRLTGSYIDFDGFDLAPLGTNHISTGVDLVGNHINFTRNKIHDINITTTDTGSGIGVGGTENYIDRNYVYRCGNDSLDHCIYAYTGHANYITNNIVGNASGWCITLWHNAYEVHIYNNTVFNGRRALGSNGGGILIGAGERPDSDARNCIVANNIVYGSQGDGILESGIVHNNTYINNMLFNNAWGNITLLNGTQRGTIISDPNFVNYKADGTGDYRLQSGSLAINRADPTYAPSIDFDGAPRSTPDIGAYEFQGGNIVFEDQFSIDGSPSPTDWNIINTPGFGMDDVVFTNRSVNVVQSNGNLLLTSRRELYRGMHYTCGCIAGGITGIKHQWLYGSFECRCKAGTGNMWWPAFWMLGSTQPGPREIDIMEYNTKWWPLNSFATNVHTDHYNAYNFTKSVPDLDTGFHVFRLDWTPTKLEFFLDGVSYATVTGEDAAFFNSPMYLLLDSAIDVHNTKTPAVSLPKSLVVDYVRVTQ